MEMMNKKCELGNTNFIYPPRPCDPNLWKEEKMKKTNSAWNGVEGGFLW